MLISFVTLVHRRARAQAAGAAADRGAGAAVGPPLDRIATLARPVIWLLSRSTDGVVRLAGGDPAANREASPRRSCAGWSPRTSRCRRTSAS